MEFKPGIRFEKKELLKIAGSLAVSAAIFQTSPYIAFLIIFVLCHFLLFCNVFRITRSGELKWGALFIVFFLPAFYDACHMEAVFYSHAYGNNSYHSARNAQKILSRNFLAKSEP